MACVLTARGAVAYTIETPITRGCHEEITADALRATKAALPDMTVPLPSVGDDEPLMADVPFTVPKDLHDIGAVTLLLGARDNDVKSMAVTQFDELAGVTAQAASQKLHCLRTAQQDEPGGSRAALDDCRAYIRETLLSALDGLDASGRPDGNNRERLEVTLSIRGKIGVSVPLFYLRVGQGLHAIEDSFTHTFRSVSDPHKVTVVLNWVDYAEDNLDEHRDGPAHLKELDRCDDPDDLRTQRHKLAVESATAALTSLLDPSSDHDSKVLAVDAVIDKYISFDEGSNCTADNHWCDAPELAYAPSGCGCTSIGAPPSKAPSFVIAALVALTSLGRAKRQPRARSNRRWLAQLGSLSLVLASTPARAETPSTLGQPIAAMQGQSTAGKPGHTDPAGSFFARVGLGASYQHPAFAGSAGVRYQLNRPFMVGLDAEYNPWIALSPTRVRPGAFNSYVSLIRRFQLEKESVNIRTTVALGVSVLTFDLVGAPAGSVGPYFGLSFLGVEWKMAPGFYWTIDPTYIAFPVPHLTGVPFGYLQYRALVGIEFGGGG